MASVETEALVLAGTEWTDGYSLKIMRAEPAFLEHLVKSTSWWRHLVLRLAGILRASSSYSE